MLLKNAPTDVVKAVYEVCFDPVVRTVLQSDDHGEMQNATQCLAAIVSGGRRELLSWSGDLGFTMRCLLDVASRLLDPDLESSGSIFVGNYILQLILHLSSQMALHIRDLVAALVRRTQSCQIAGLQSSLLIIFARLVHMSLPHVDQFINLLITIPAEGHTNFLHYVMSEWTKQQGSKYDLDFKSPSKSGQNFKSAEDMIELYKELCRDYPIVSIEDPFDKEDWEQVKLFSGLGICQVVGDGLLMSNPKRIERAIQEHACNALLLKVNQLGTVTEAIEVVKMAKDAKWGVVISQRSGETDDSFLADLSVGLTTGQIKAGAPCRGERLAKYNQLLRIEEELGDQTSYVEMCTNVYVWQGAIPNRTKVVR